MVFISYRTYIPCRWLGVVINDIHTLERNNAWYVTASDQVTYMRQWIRIYHNRSMEWHMASLMFHLYLNPYCSIFISTRGEISNGVYSTFRSHVCYGVNLHAYFFYEFRHLRQMSWLDGSIHQYLWMVEIGVVSNHLFLKLYLPCAFVCIFISYLYLYLSYDFEWDHMSMHVCMCIVHVHGHASICMSIYACELWVCMGIFMHYVNGSMLDFGGSSVSAMELSRSYTEPSTCACASTNIQVFLLTHWLSDLY